MVVVCVHERVCVCARARACLCHAAGCARARAARVPVCVPLSVPRESVCVALRARVRRVRVPCYMPRMRVRVRVPVRVPVRVRVRVRVRVWTAKPWAGAFFNRPLTQLPERTCRAARFSVRAPPGDPLAVGVYESP